MGYRNRSKVTDVQANTYCIMLSAFRSYHDNGGPLAQKVIERDGATVERLHKRGLLDYDGVNYRINQHGIAYWRNVVKHWYENTYSDAKAANSRKVLLYYNADGTRKDKS